MNCDTCQDRLLDLLYEEIEGTEAEEARAHVERCDPCRESYEKLGFAQRMAAALPEEEPDRALDARILAAARQKVGAEPERAQPERHRDRDEDDDGLWASILRWLTGFAASPQFVMATIMMLVVAIGLWYLPSGRRQPEAGGETVATVDQQDEAAPSATLEPAEPLELDIDERTGRLRHRGGGQAPGAGTVTLAEAAEAAEQQAETPTDREHATGGAARPGEVTQQGETTARNRAQAGEAAGDVMADDLGALADGDAPAAEMEIGSGGSFGTGAAEQQPQRRAARTAAPSAAASGGAAAGAPETERSEGGYAYAPSAPSQQAPSPPPAAADEEGIPAPSGAGASETMATALHMRARREAQNESCNQAVQTYRHLLSRYPTYSRSPLAMVEEADCLRRLGRLSEAHRLYQRAERYRSVATRARRGRYHVEQMQRSRVRAVDEAAAEPAEAY